LSRVDEATQEYLGFSSQESDLEAFLQQTQCFEDQFLYDILRNVGLKETAHEEMIDACVDTAVSEYDITDDQQKTLADYLKKERKETLVNFLEIAKTRRLVIQRALKSELITRTLDDIDLNSLHNKIANLPPGPQTRRIQDVWNTLTGGFKVQDGETIKQAFERIQQSGTE